MLSFLPDCIYGKLTEEDVYLLFTCLLTAFCLSDSLPLPKLSDSGPSANNIVSAVFARSC